MQKVLVAGSTGYLGKYVVREFKRRGYWVRALARNQSVEKLEEIGPFLEPAVRHHIDEVFVGEVTRPESLRGLCDGIDIVFSSIGITRQRDKVSFMDVDYRGNRNALDLATDASVGRFVFVSVFNHHQIDHLVRPRELFVGELRNCGLDYAVIRPTGYFSDMNEVLKMAASGRVYLIGEGSHTINPIHGADLAKVCVDAVDSQEREIPVGGPLTYTHTEIAELAFSVLGKTPKITRIPGGLVNRMVKMIRPFSEHCYTLAAFFSTAMQLDFDASKTGTHTLKEFYEEIAPRM